MRIHVSPNLSRLAVWVSRGALVPLFFLASCSWIAPQPPNPVTVHNLVHQAITDDKAGAEIENRLTLLNIVRAYQHEPRYYVTIQAWQQGLPTYNATLGRILGIPSVANTSATISTQSNTSSSGISPLTAEHFERAITKPISVKTVAYFADQGFPVSVLLHLFVREIKVYDAQGNLSGVYINAPMEPDRYKQFDALVNGLSACRMTTERNDTFPDARDVIGPPVSAKEAGSLKRQVDILSKQFLLVPVIKTDDESKTTSSANCVNTKDANTSCAIRKTETLYYLIPGRTPQLAFHTDTSMPDVVQQYCKHAITQMTTLPPPTPVNIAYDDVTQTPKLKPGFPRMDMEFRSPEATVYYLGEVLRREFHGTWNYSDQTFNTGKHVSLGAVRYKKDCTNKPGQSDCHVQCLDLFVVLRMLASEKSWESVPSGFCMLPSTKKDNTELVRVQSVDPTLDTNANAPTLAHINESRTQYALPPYRGDNMNTALVFTLIEQAVDLQTDASGLPGTTYVHVIP